MLTVTEGRRRVAKLREEWFDRLPTETVALDSVAGRALAEPIDAPVDVPEHGHATMDGYAFDATEGYPYKLAGVEVFPEDSPPSIAPGEAVRIYTGAALPPSTNAVLKQEEARVEDGRLSGTPTEPGFTYAIPVSLSDGDAVPLGHADSPLSVYTETFDPSVLSSSTRATRADGFVLTESALSASESVDVLLHTSLER